MLRTPNSHSGAHQRLKNFNPRRDAKPFSSENGEALNRWEEKGEGERIGKARTDTPMRSAT